MWLAHFSISLSATTHTHTHTSACAHTHTQCDIWGKVCTVRRLRVPLMITTLHLNNLHPSSSTLTSALSLSLKSLSTPPHPLPPSTFHPLSPFPALSFSSPASALSIFACVVLIFHQHLCFASHPNSTHAVFSSQPSLKSIFNDDVISAFMCNLARVSVWMRHCQLYGVKHLFSVNGCSWWYTNQNPADVWWICLLHFCSCMQYTTVHVCIQCTSIYIETHTERC